MTYSEFEIAVNDYVNDNWDADLAALVSEYKTVEKDPNFPTLEVQIGVNSADPGCLGTVGVEDKDFDFVDGTVNLVLKFPANYGLVKVSALVQAGIELFNNKMIQGYIKFRSSYPLQASQKDNLKSKIIICPFTVETIT